MQLYCVAVTVENLLHFLLRTIHIPPQAREVLRLVTLFKVEVQLISGYVGHLRGEETCAKGFVPSGLTTVI